MIFEATGIHEFRIAAQVEKIEVGAGVKLVSSESKGLPSVVTVDAVGWLHYDEIDGVHCFRLGDPPVYEKPAEIEVDEITEAIETLDRYYSTVDLVTKEVADKMVALNVKVGAKVTAAVTLG
jgi:hypothetical protein